MARPCASTLALAGRHLHHQAAQVEGAGLSSSTEASPAGAQSLERPAGWSWVAIG